VGVSCSHNEWHLVISQVFCDGHHWLLHFSDIKVIRDGMADKVSVVLQYLSMTIAGLIIALVYAWRLALVTLAIAPLIGISTGLIVVVSIITKIQQRTAPFPNFSCVQGPSSVVI